LTACDFSQSIYPSWNPINVIESHHDNEQTRSAALK